MRFEDETFRAVVIASMNMMSNAVNAWWSIIFYGAEYAPYFTVSILVSIRFGKWLIIEQRGMWAMIATCIALGLWTTIVLWLTVRAEKRRLIMIGENSDVKEADLGQQNTERLDEKV